MENFQVLLVLDMRAPGRFCTNNFPYAISAVLSIALPGIVHKRSFRLRKEEAMHVRFLTFWDSDADERGEKTRVIPPEGQSINGWNVNSGS